METAEVIVVFLLAMVFLGVLARRLGVPYPSLFVLGGLVLGLIPSVPQPVLAPELILLVFVPPLVSSGAWFASLRDLRANVLPIIWLAIGLVLVTTGVVAVVSHSAMGLSLGVAFVLGAVVSPNDDVAVIALTQTLRLPRRITTIVTAEGLFNDVISLVAYSFGVAAVTRGVFSLGAAVLSLAVLAVGGVAIGLAAGIFFDWVMRRLDDVTLEIPFTLLVPYAVYLVATEAGVSAVLAVVVMAIYGGRHEARTFRARSRRPVLAVWQALTYVLNGFLFILVGLEFPGVLRELVGPSLAVVIGYAALLSLTVILFRLIWVFAMSYFAGLVSPSARPSSRQVNWRYSIILGWAGTRGAISLAAALALPLSFPDRNLIIFLTFGVIFTTLVLQGLSLPLMLRWLHVADTGTVDREERVARVAGAEAALRALDNRAVTGAYPAAVVADLRSHYTTDLHRQLRELGLAHAERLLPSEDWASLSRRLRLELIAAERHAIIRLRDVGQIGDEAMRRVERDLDLEELRLT